MIQFNVLSEIIFKSEQVLKISNDVLEMLYSCIGKKEGAFFWIMRHIYVCILNLKLYFERVEIFLWQFWHLCGCAGAGRGSSDCTSLCCPGLGRGRPGAQPVRRTRRPGLRGQREREREQLSVQPRQSASAERPRDRQSVTITSVTVSRARHCHAPITLLAASVTHEPVRSSCGGQVWRRSGVTSEARGQPHAPVSPSVPCDLPSCQHPCWHPLLTDLSLQERERRESWCWSVAVASSLCSLLGSPQLTIDSR